MLREDIHGLMSLLGVRDVRDRDDWVSSTCPFGPWTHENGISTRNSFGVSIGSYSGYHCFSCGKRGSLVDLPFTMFVISGKDNQELRDFVTRNERVSTAELLDEQWKRRERRVLPILSDKQVDAFYRRGDPIPNSFLTEKQYTAATILRWGIEYDPYRHRVVMFIRDRFSRLVGIKGRWHKPDDWVAEPPVKYFLYAKGIAPSAGGIWYGMHLTLVPGKKLVLTEGELDAVSLSNAGIQNVWSSMGASVTKEQIESLTDVTNPLILFFDNDAAGKEAAKKIAKSMKGLVPVYQVTDYHGCKDADEAVRKGVAYDVLRSAKGLDII